MQCVIIRGPIRGEGATPETGRNGRNAPSYVGPIPARSPYIIVLYVLYSKITFYYVKEDVSVLARAPTLCDLSAPVRTVRTKRLFWRRFGLFWPSHYSRNPNTCREPVRIGTKVRQGSLRMV